MCPPPSTLLYLLGLLIFFWGIFALLRSKENRLRNRRDDNLIKAFYKKFPRCPKCGGRTYTLFKIIQLQYQCEWESSDSDSEGNPIYDIKTTYFGKQNNGIYCKNCRSLINSYELKDIEQEISPLNSPDYRHAVATKWYLATSSHLNCDLFRIDYDPPLLIKKYCEIDSVEKMREIAVDIPLHRLVIGNMKRKLKNRDALVEFHCSLQFQLQLLSSVSCCFFPTTAFVKKAVASGIHPQNLL